MDGKVNGSQRDRDSKTGLIDLLVYYEVPLGQRDEVKQKFDNFVRNNKWRYKEINLSILLLDLYRNVISSCLSIISNLLLRLRRYFLLVNVSSHIIQIFLLVSLYCIFVSGFCQNPSIIDDSLLNPPNLDCILS